MLAVELPTGGGELLSILAIGLAIAGRRAACNASRRAARNAGHRASLNTSCNAELEVAGIPYQHNCSYPKGRLVKPSSNVPYYLPIDH
jgi:hypothetical protein